MVLSLDKFDLMRQRHSVRAYLDKDIDSEHVLIMQKAIDRYNKMTRLLSIAAWLNMVSLKV